MDLANSFQGFIERINDAYVAGLTLNQLITDLDLQRLTLKHGKAVGMPIGNKHLFPGYWFMALVVPFEYTKRMADLVRIIDKENTPVESPLVTGVTQLCHRMETDLNASSLELRINRDTFPSKNRKLYHLRNAISQGSYLFTEENGDVVVTFNDHDYLCDYEFDASTSVRSINKFAADVTGQITSWSQPLISLGFKTNGRKLSGNNNNMYDL